MLYFKVGEMQFRVTKEREAYAHLTLLKVFSDAAFIQILKSIYNN